jgi:hypothetical protein
VVPTLESLNKEGLIMQHCIYTYLNRICERQYLAVHVQHLISNERATIGLIRSGKTLEFEQLKGYQNSRATKEMIETVMKFCRENGIAMNSGRNSDLTPTKTYQKKMSDYLSEEELESVRKERAERESKNEDELSMKDLVEKVTKKPRKFLGNILKF